MDINQALKSVERQAVQDPYSEYDGGMFSPADAEDLRKPSALHRYQEGMRPSAHQMLIKRQRGES